MNNNIALGQYLPGNSWVHQLDPRAKLICMTLAIILVISAQKTSALVLISLWIVTVLCVSGVKPFIYWQSSKPLWILLMISFLLQALFTAGDPLFSLGFIQVTREGLNLSGWLLWRISALLLLAAALTFTTTPLQLTAALEWLLTPLKYLRFPVSEVAMMINLSLRFVPTLFEEAGMLLAAQQSRGVSFSEGNLRQRMHKLMPFMAPLITNLFKHADELAYAMEIRCYQTGAKRSRMNVLRFAARDVMAIIISGIMLALVSAIGFGVIPCVI